MSFRAGPPLSILGSEYEKFLVRKVLKLQKFLNWLCAASLIFEFINSFPKVQDASDPALLNN